MVETASPPALDVQATALWSRAAHAGHFSDPSFEASLLRWMAAELLADQYARLDGARFASEAKIPLADVYLDLPVLEICDAPRAPDTATTEGTAPVLARLHRADLEGVTQRDARGTSERVAPPRVVPLQRAVVVGGPGQGKSTVAQQLAQVHRAAWLAVKRGSLLERQRVALDRVTLGAARDGIAPGKLRFPLRLVLPAFMGWMARGDDSDLPRTLAAYASARARQHNVALSPDDLVAWMRTVPWLLVLDGLDEVPDRDDRATLHEAIDAFHAQLTEGDGVTVTFTRPQGYGGEDGAAWQVELQPLPKDAALGYALRLADGWFPEEPDARGRLRERLQRAAADEGTARLMQSPLQVTIITALLHRVPRAPSERWRLFRTYFDTIYEREMDRPVPSAQVLADHRTVIESIHWQIGLFLQMRAEAKGGAEPTLSIDELRAVIRARIAREGYSAEALAAVSDAIEVAAKQRLVLLVEPSPGRFGFELRSFQEFAAAEALMEGHDAPIAERLKAVATSHVWRNVLLFAMSRALSSSGDLQDVCVEVCRWLNQANELDAARYAGSHLAARVLDEEMASKSPRVVQGLLAVVLEALGSHSSREATMIARVADKIAHDPTLASEGEATVRAAVENGLHAAPSNAPVLWSVASKLAENGKEWARAAVLMHWPEAHEERRKLMRLNGQHADFAWSDTRHPGGFDKVWTELARQRFARAPRADDGWRAQLDRALSLVHMHREAGKGVFFWTDTPPPDGLEWSPSNAHAFETHEDRARYASLLAFLRHPGAGTLAEAVRAIAHTGVASWRGAYGQVPWQLSACIDALDAGEAAEELVARIEAGALGDTADWVQARTRWLDAPLDPTEYGVLETVEWPFGPSIATHGFPPVEVNFLGSHEQAIAAEESLWQGIDDATLWGQRIRLRRLHRLWHRTTEGAVVERLEVLSKRVALFAKHGFTVYFGSLIDHFVKGDPNRLASLLDLIEHADFTMVDDYAYLQHGNLLERTWPLRPQSIRIPKALARRSEVSSLSPLLLADLPTGDDASRAARFVLRYRAGLVTAPEVDALRPLLRRVARAQPDLFAQCWNVRVTRRNSAVAFPLLLRLDRWLADYHHALHPLEDWYYLSRLLDEEAFRSLGLPLPPWASTLRDALTPLADEPVILLREIHLLNLRAFTDVTLPSPAATPATQAPWIILLGENGVGKTTILRALAFALADPDAVAGAMAKSAAPYRRDRDRDAAATVSVDLGAQHFGARILTDNDRERIEPFGADDRPFLVAYGCRRGSAFGGPDRAVNVEPAYDIATLFEETAEGLVHAESWLKDLDRRALRDPDGEGGRTRRAVLHVLCGDGRRPGLLPGVREILFDRDPDRLVVVGDAVGEAPLSALSDGYLTMMGWTIDLMARWIHRQRKRGHAVTERFAELMTGVVLIDEVDMHLHPRWQYDVIQTLRERFPRLTFVATTHNPMTILRARPGELFVLRREPDGGVSARQLDVPPGVRADDLLTGPWFGLVSTTDPETLRLFEEHQRLLREGRAHDDPEVARLVASLRTRLGRFGDTSIERMVQKVLADLRPSMSTPPSPEEREVMARRAAEILRKRREAKGGEA